MWIGYLMQALGSMGLFASRAFVPAFAAALLLRFGPEWGFIADKGLLASLGISGTPSWFTSNECLVVLGILAGLEVAATKNPDARALLNHVDKYAKPVMAALTMLGLTSAADADFATGVIGSAGEAAVLLPVAAGVTVGGILSGISAAGTYLLAGVRSLIVGLLTDADEDDDTGVQKLLSWAEDIYALFGIFFLILFPIVMFAIIAFFSGLMFLLRWWVLRKEEKSKVPCVECGELMYRCALACGKCKNENATVCDVGWLGQSDTDDPADMATQVYQLAEAKRCPLCATKLKERRPRQFCEACETELFADPAFVEAYANRVAARLPLVLLVCIGLSFIPVIGLIPGVIYYRMALVAPFRRYVPWGRSVMAKWGIRLLFFVLVAIQWVPVLGAVTVPAMAVVSFLTYRGLFMGLTDEPAERPEGTGTGGVVVATG